MSLIRFVCLPMDSNQLKDIAKELNLTNFLGVYAADELSSIPAGKCGTVIFNTDPSEKKGEHWIALCITKKNIFYFDSLNLQFVFIHEAANFLVNLKKDLVFNKIKTQTNTSNNCGIQCIVFCIFMSTSGTRARYEEFLSLFLPFNVEERDRFVAFFYSYIRSK